MAQKGTEKRTITVRLNGEEQDFTEKLVIADWQEAKDEAASAAEKAEDEEFDWVLPDEEPFEVPEYRPAPVYAAGNPAITSFKRNRKGWLKGKGLLILSAISAVAIGLLLGLLILNITLPASKEIDAAGGKLAEAEKEAEPEKAAEAKKIILPALEVALVQAGVFSTEEAGNEMAESLKGRGQPAALLEMDGKFYLFSGVATDIITAKAIENKWKAAGEDVWAKPVSFPEIEQEITAGAGDAPAAERGAFSLLAEATGKAAVTGKLDGEEVKAAKAKWSAAGSGPETDSGKAIGRAFGEAEAFSQTGAPEKILSSQQALLDYLKLSLKTGPKP